MDQAAETARLLEAYSLLKGTSQPTKAALTEAADALRASVRTTPVKQPITVEDLMMHTAGLLYGDSAHPLDALYDSVDCGWDVMSKGIDLAEFCRRVGALPLMYQPGEHWRYSFATEVLGRLIEVLAKETLDEFLQREVLGPLGMVDTAFWVEPEKLPRLATLYEARRPDEAARGETDVEPAETGSQNWFHKGGEADVSVAGRFDVPPTMLSGGGGLVTTLNDYIKFAKMVLNRGKAADGCRILGRKTIEHMRCNHLPYNNSTGQRYDLNSIALECGFSEASFDGIGFGLGFSVMLDPVKAQVLGTRGSHSWGGWASTVFWIDPVEELAVISLAQLVPSSQYPLRTQLRTLVYQAVTEDCVYTSQPVDEAGFEGKTCRHGPGVVSRHRRLSHKGKGVRWSQKGGGKGHNGSSPRDLSRSQSF